MNAENENKKSIGGNLWKIAEADERVVELLMQRLQIPYLLAKILVLRGVSIYEAEKFLEPKIQNLMPNPFVLKDMEKAAKRIAQAVVDKQKIAIIGDYDVDGATSSSVLKMFLEACGNEPELHIPE